jgi:hypothetical protein
LNITSNILDTPKISGMVLLWSKFDYNYDYDSKSLTANNNKDITQTIIEPDTIDKQFFSGRNLENVITNLQNDPLALSCWVSRSLDKIVISKKKKGDMI